MPAPPDILVVGAGPAGVSAAIEAATRGARVLLIEQRPHPGGAIHRPAHDGGPSAVPMPARHKKNWARLQSELARRSARIQLLTSAVFLGIDGNGVCMIDSRDTGRVKLIRPRAVIFAMGASERVPHIPGWELPGVVTAGGLQVQMKESGQAPQGRILVAGNGPLPLALGAQLAALGNAPVAVLEAADPYRNIWVRPAAVLGLAAGPRQLLEAASYFRALRSAGVPYRTGTAVTAVTAATDGRAATAASPGDAGLRVRTRDRHGKARDYQVDLLVLHGGLACNDRGIPAGDTHGIVIARAGDCNRVLGADAALGEGRRVAAAVIAKLERASARAGMLAPVDRQAGTPGKAAVVRGRAEAPESLGPVRGRADASGRHAPWATAFQKSIASLFHCAAAPAEPDVVICRCEGVTRRALAEQGLHSARETRLVGRIGMGLCQGRFCAHAAATGMAGNDMSAQDSLLTLAEIDGPIPRWPIRPVSVKALADAQDL